MRLSGLASRPAGRLLACSSLALGLVLGACDDGGASPSADIGPADAATTDVDGDADAPDATPGPTLRMNHFQAVGTHNSYHLRPTYLEPDEVIPDWDYDHLPLDGQLDEQGVRQFELDIFSDEDGGGPRVLHLPLLDPETTCETLVACLEAMKGWSDTHLDHHPLLVLLEVKDQAPVNGKGALLAQIDADIRSVWPDDRLVTPAWVMGDAPTVRDALADSGWPTLDASRGRALFVLHSGSYAPAYLVDGDTDLARPMFVDAYGDVDLPYAAVHSMNGPVGGFDAIQAVVSAGHIVRTRADSGGDDDPDRVAAAFASGAHAVSTDHPIDARLAESDPPDEFSVWTPGGSPSRCNPLAAPDGCTSQLVEDLGPPPGMP